MSRLLKALGLAALLLFPVIALAQTAGFIATVTADSAELRKGANEQAPVAGSVKKGTVLPAFGLSPDKQWVRVKGPDGSTLWAKRADVKVGKADAAAAAPTPTPPPAGGGDGIPDELMAGGGKPKATPTPPGGRGGPGGGKKPGGGERKFGHIVVPKAKIQLNPTKSAPLTAMVPKGETLQIGGFSRDKQWVKVRTRDGRIGWVQKSDIRPGRGPGKTGATASGTGGGRKPPRGGDDFDDPNSGFSDPNSGFGDGGRGGGRRGSPKSASTTIWADVGMVSIQQTLETNEGFGYTMDASGFGAGIRFEQRLFAGLFIEGGYLGTQNGRIPVPESTVSIFSSLHRGDAGIRYRLLFTDDYGPSISALAGFQNYSLLVQPQSFSWFYSQIYMGGAFGLGAEYGVGGLRIWGEGRALVPVSTSQRYGNGGAGGDGQNNTATGIAYAGGLHYRFYSGSQLGLAYRAATYQTEFTGIGQRGPYEISGAKLTDNFSTVTLFFARGF